MAIADDWTIDYINKRIYHSAGTTVYTVREFYSWLMDTFDELAQMDDPIPMSASTPTDYTLLNGWFIPYTSFEYLKGGSIATSGWDGASNAGGIVKITFEESGYTDAVSTDIGKQVVGGTSGHTGTLLDYDNTNRIWWVRNDNANELFQDGETLSVSGGTGSGTIATGGRETGESLWSNVYTLGTIESDTNIYIYYGTYPLQPTDEIAAWWPQGHIDVLILIKEFDTLKGNGYITIFARNYGDYYDYFEIDISGGGRNPVPLSTSTDIDNQTEESTVQNYNDIIIAQVDGKLNYTNPSDSFQEWETVTGGTSGATGIVLYDDTDNDYLILGQVEGTFQDGETITGGTSGTTATVNGTLDVSVTTLNQDLNNGNGPQPYDIHINCATRPLSEVYEYMKYITRKDSSWYIIQNDGSQNYTTYGEVYKFAQTTYTPVKPAPFGQYLGGTLFGARGIWIENMDSSDAKNFQLRDSNDTIQTPPNVVAVTVTSVVSGDRVAVFRLTQAGGEIDRQRYQLAYIHGDSVQFYNADTTNYTDETTDAAESTADDVYLPPQQSTTEGDAIYFGSNYKFSEVRINVTTPGNYSDITIVWEYWNGSAWTSLSVTDNTNGFTVSGTNEVTFTPPGDWAKTTVNGVLAYYIRARATFGASPSITTAPLAGECWNWHNYNGSNVVAIGTSISGDEPQSGTVRIVKTDGTDDIYSYDSWSGQRFVLSGTLSTDYSENQYVYVPIIDAEATSSSVTNTLIYSSDIPVLVRVRKYGIQPFQVESTITDVGLTVSAIRTTDNIVL